MVYQPKTTDEIQSNLIDRLTGKLQKLTNFVSGSFNNLWTLAFSERLRRNEEALLAAQLSGWIDYAGGPVTDSDLEALGITSVSAEDVNKYMHDDDLEELVKIVGVERDPGDRATGRVTITTSNDSVTIPEGTEFGTEPDTNGNYLSFYTDKEVTPDDGTTTVSVSVTAEEPGEEYNVGSAQITYLPNPPNGVEDVTNTESTTGGVDPENNEDLRSRAKNSVLENSGGGTVDGIEGYIESNVEGVITARVDEFPDSSPPYADVIVDGGDTTAVEDAIDVSHPSGVRHNLVRPTIYTVNVDAVIEGDNTDTDSAETLVTNYIDGLELGENLYRDKVIQKIMNSDVDIDNIKSLTISIADEPHTFSSGTNVYTLDKTLEDDDGSKSREMGITEVTGTESGSSHTFTEDTDYQEWNSSSGDTSTPHDSIDWSLAGVTPDDSTTFYVDYVVPNDISVSARENAEPGVINVTVA